MSIHEQVHDAITNHKNKIELTQWAIMSAIASLVYSEFLKNIKQKQYPRKMIIVPSIRNIQELLLLDGEMFTSLSSNLIEMIQQNPLFQKYKEAPEFEMFTDKNIEIMKTILELYILPNVNKRLPESIALKFDLYNQENQLITQSRDLDLFHRQPFHTNQLNYVVEETILNLLTLIPSMCKTVDYPEQNISIFMTDEEILTISNENALCPIHFTTKMFHETESTLLNTLLFVTNTNIEENDWNIHSYMKEFPHSGEHLSVSYIIDTGLFNSVSLTRCICINDDYLKTKEG